MDYPETYCYFHRAYGITGCLHDSLGNHPERHGYHADKKDTHIRGAFRHDFGLEPERFRLEWVSASEGQKFAGVITEMVEDLTALGPSPYGM